MKGWERQELNYSFSKIRVDDLEEELAVCKGELALQCENAVSSFEECAALKVRYDTSDTQKELRHFSLPIPHNNHVL